MEINKIEAPMYRLTLTAEEMTMLYSLTVTAYQDHQIKHAHYFFDKLEDARPAGGFVQEIVQKKEIKNKPEFFNGDYNTVTAEIIIVLEKHSTDIDESRAVLGKVIGELDYQARKCKVKMR